MVSSLDPQLLQFEVQFIARRRKLNQTYKKITESGDQDQSNKNKLVITCKAKYKFSFTSFCLQSFILENPVF